MGVVNAALVRSIPAELPDGSAAREVRPSHRMKRRIVLFLDKIAGGYSVRAAAKAAGISFSRAYQLRRMSPAFAAVWDEALDMGTQLLEDTLTRQALKGNVAALAILLKARAPERYRERFDGEIRGKATSEAGPVTVEWSMDFRLGADTDTSG